MFKYRKYVFSFLLLITMFFGFSGCKADKATTLDDVESSGIASDDAESSNTALDDTVSSGLIIQDDIVMFPEPKGLVEVKVDTLGEPLPTSKDEGDLDVMLKFTAGGTTLETFGQIKVQGSSTAKWPKKNWTLKFYNDEERSERLRLKIGDSVASDKWIAKAEWLDPTTLRNGLSFRLWEAMVTSRKNFPQYEVDYAWIGKNNMSEGVQTGAQGFPKSHPINVKVNDEHYGISMLLLGHDPKNFNIDYNNSNHIYMEFDARGGYTTTKTWDKFSAEGIGEWIDGYHPKNEDMTEQQKVAIDELGKFLNSPQKNFEENFDKYLDKTNMIDMLLFLEAIYDWDAVAQDIEMVTYDLEKWFMLPWDKDTSFGMFWDQSGLLKDSEKLLLINYESEKPNQKPWFKTYHAFTSDVEKRYAQLRDEDIFSAKGLYEMTGDITKKIPKEMWEHERLRWKEDERPSLDETSTAQIITWFEERLKTLDVHFNYIE